MPLLVRRQVFGTPSSVQKVYCWLFMPTHTGHRIKPRHVRLLSYKCICAVPLNRNTLLSSLFQNRLRETGWNKAGFLRSNATDYEWVPTVLEKMAQVSICFSFQLHKCTAFYCLRFPTFLIHFVPLFKTYSEASPHNSFCDIEFSFDADSHPPMDEIRINQPCFLFPLYWYIYVFVYNWDWYLTYLVWSHPWMGSFSYFLFLFFHFTFSWENWLRGFCSAGCCLLPSAHWRHWRTTKV